MLGYKRIVVAQHERGLYLRDRSIVKILKPGIYHFYDPLSRVTVEIHSVIESEFNHPFIDLMLQQQAELVNTNFQVVELGDYQVGVVYKNGKFSGIQVPATRQLYWRGPIEVKVDVLDISEHYALPATIVGIVANAAKNKVNLIASDAIQVVRVLENHVGLLLVDGELVEKLSAGVYAYFSFNRHIAVELVDLRVQVIEVQGQEILTKDKVSLRINLAAHYKVSDVVQARNTLKRYDEYLYRELQFALRQAVSARNLDGLLGNKDELDNDIHKTIQEKMQLHGIDVTNVGIKDVILPGDMKEILNHVVETEKSAQANVIKRREETAATRSLLNTARLMDENPTLMRLKELEVLEKVTEKVDKLTVFGGLESVLKETVNIQVKSGD